MTERRVECAHILFSENGRLAGHQAVLCRSTCTCTTARVTSRLVDALKAMDSQLATRAENMAITSSFGDLGVVLNAPTTNKRVGLITGSTAMYSSVGMRSVR